MQKVLISLFMSYVMCNIWECFYMHGLDVTNILVRPDPAGQGMYWQVTACVPARQSMYPATI